MKHRSAATVVASFATAALTVLAQPALAADHNIGRGVITGGYTGGGGLGGAHVDYGVGRMQQLGQGDWSHEDGYNCLGDDDHPMGNCVYWYTFSFSPTTGGTVSGTSADGGTTFNLQGTGQLTGWTGNVRLEDRNLDGQDIVVFIGDLNKPRKSR